MPAQNARARLAVAATFFVNGALIGVWAANIPGVKERLALDPQILSLGFLAMAAGALVGMPLGGWLIARHGSARVTLSSGLGFLALLPFPVLAPGFATLVFALAAFGLVNGVMDVAMNAHGVLVEGRLARPVMSSFHAMWSAGGLAGSALGGLALGGVGPVALCIGACIAGLAILAPAAGLLLPTVLDRQPGASHFAMPSRVTLALGSLAFLGMMSEGAILDWSGIYLRDLRASPELAAWGFAGFSATMCLARFFGDPLRARFGASRLVRASGLVSLAGLAAALLAPGPALAVLGFAVMGFGIANIAPVIYGAAGRLKGASPGVSIASVVTMGYAGFLVGPPVIGFAAHLATLQTGLSFVGLACVLVVSMSDAAET